MINWKSALEALKGGQWIFLLVMFIISTGLVIIGKLPSIKDRRWVVFGIIMYILTILSYIQMYIDELP